MYSKVLVALAAASTFLTQASGHMIMLTPTPFNNATIDNSPLEATGANFPCKSTGSSSFYNAAGISNTMAVGSTNTLSFRGSAIHGGGSCQVALTKDQAPTPSSSWEVILSIEGGCPGITSPSTFQYQIPTSVSAGNYVLAWTWVSKEAGQPEYYMNCAPVTITSGSKKRATEAEDTNALDTRQSSALPQLFVANLASINSCKTTPGTDPQYPDPGSNVQQPNKAANYAKITQTGCVPKGASDTTTGGGSTSGSGNSSAAGSAPSAAPSGSSGSGSGSGSSSAAGAAPSSPPSSAAGSGSGSGSGSMTTLASSSSVVATPMSMPTSTADSGSGASASVAAPSAAASTAAGVPPPSSSGTSTGGSGSGLTGACSDEGAWNCVGGSAFQRCASGQWSAMIPMASGTTCTPGQSDSLSIARRGFVVPRFPGLRRHREILKNINV